MTENPSIPASTEKLSIVDKYFSFKKEQRIGRMSFFLRTLIKLTVFVLTGSVLLRLINFTLDMHEANILPMYQQFIYWSIIAGLTLLYTSIYFYITTIFWTKRMHDLGVSGWWYFLIFYLIPIPIGVINYFIITDLKVLNWSIFIVGVLVLLLKRGNLGSNKYGPATTGTPLV